MNRNRRRLLGHAGAIAPLALFAGLPLPARAANLIMKAIPSSGETISVIGVGTARRYQGAAGEAELAPLRDSLRTFLELGGSVIDTAPSYGNAEAVVGKLLADLQPSPAVFLATKLGEPGVTPAGSRSSNRSAICSAGRST